MYLHEALMARVSKWGNSLAVRLPAALGFEEGQEVFVRKGAAGEVILTVEDDAADRARAKQKEEALRKLASFNWKLPADYKFDRDEANER